MKYQCLVVDDEKPLADSTAEYFNLFGIHTMAVYDAESCLHFLQENAVDIILLDINLKQESGFKLCQKLRQTTQIPIFFISARQSDDDVLLGLTIGGDDYIKKPYKLSILLAKVKAVLKRYAIQEEATYHSKQFEIDLKANRVIKNGIPLKLKAMEYKLFCYLVYNKGRVISKEELFSNVWGDTFTGDGTLNVHIRHLREQIEEDPNNPVFIQTIWGTGYLFEE